MQQLIKGLDYTHRMGVSNRDVKLKNVILGSDTDERPTIRLADWGLSKSDSTSVPKSPRGTHGFMAPEVMHRYTHFVGTEGKYDSRLADIFSSAVCLFRMLYGHAAVMDTSPELETYDVPETFPEQSINFDFDRKTTAGEELPKISKECREFLTGTLQHNPNNRMSMERIWEHCWFRQGLKPDFRATDAMIQQHKSLEESDEGIVKRQELKNVLKAL